MIEALHPHRSIAAEASNLALKSTSCVSSEAVQNGQSSIHLLLETTLDYQIIPVTVTLSLSLLYYSWYLFSLDALFVRSRSYVLPTFGAAVAKKGPEIKTGSLVLFVGGIVGTKEFLVSRLLLR